MGDPVLNDPTQPLSFDNLTQIELTEAVFKGVIPNGLRFSNCTKLAISGTVNSTSALLRQIDPLNLEKLVSFTLDVADAEEEGVAAHIGDKPSHLLMALKFVDSVASSDLTTVRINFNSLHLAHVISAFSSARTILTDEDETDLANSNVFSKVGKLVAITTDQMSVPMQFLNDLDLTSSAFLTKHYKVTH